MSSKMTQKLHYKENFFETIFNGTTSTLACLMILLFCSRGEMASCWYILLSGAVFIDGSMYLPRSR